jgi:hypothetical protein
MQPPLYWELLHCLRCGVDFTFGSHSPALVHTLSTTLLFFNIYVLILIFAGLFPGAGDLGSGTDGQFYTALSLRGKLINEYLPGYTFAIDRTLYGFNLICAILPLLATSSMHRFRGVYYALALCFLFVALLVDAALTFPIIHEIFPWTAYTTAPSNGFEFVLLTLRVVTRTILFFLLKAGLFAALLCARHPGAPQDASAVLWRSAYNALTPEPALWALPWASKPADSLRAVAAGGFVGLARSAYSLLDCVPTKHLTAALLTFFLLTLVVTLYAMDVSYYEDVFAYFAAEMSVVRGLVPAIPTDNRALKNYLLFAVKIAEVVFATLKDYFFLVRPAIWLVYAISVLGMLASLVCAARDHLRVMFSFPCPSHLPVLPAPPFLAQAASARSLRLHREGDAPPGWGSASLSFYAQPWYCLTKRCGLGGQPDGPRPASGLPPPPAAPASEPEAAAAPAAATAITYELPDVSPCLDSNLIASFTYIPFFVLSQAVFVVYVRGLPAHSPNVPF